MISWSSVFCHAGALGADVMTITVSYWVAFGTTNSQSSTQFDVAPTDVQAVIKANAVAAIIADAATLGYTLTGTDILFQDGTRGL